MVCIWEDKRFYKYHYVECIKGMTIKTDNGIEFIGNVLKKKGKNGLFGYYVHTSDKFY